MNMVKEKGFTDNYAGTTIQPHVSLCLINNVGIRVSLDGKRFQIESAAIWNIIIDNKLLGQAATFPTWSYL